MYFLFQFDFSPLRKGLKGSIASVTYPGWAQFVIFVFITIAMIPTIIWLVIDFAKSPSKWIQGFRSTFSNPHEYHPDPSYLDPSRRKSPEEVEIAILKETDDHL